MANGKSRGDQLTDIVGGLIGILGTTAAYWNLFVIERGSVLPPSTGTAIGGTFDIAAAGAGIAGFNVVRNKKLRMIGTILPAIPIALVIGQYFSAAKIPTS
jgi:hypothetical protein